MTGSKGYLMEWALHLVPLLNPFIMMFMYRGHKGHNHGDDTEIKHDQRYYNHPSELVRLDN